MNPEANEIPATDKPHTVRQRLSTLLRAVPADECCRILSEFEAGISKGAVKAVPLLGEHFGKVVVLENGQKKRATLQDELVVVDEVWQRWFTGQRRESRYRVMTHAGVVVTTIERIKSGEDDFDRLLEIRRKRLKSAQQKGASS